MKNNLPLILIFLLSCGGNGPSVTGDETEEIISTTVEYNSDLRPEIKEWDMLDIYVDTVEFIDYNDDADYSFMVIKTDQGREVNVVTDEFVDRDYLQDGRLIIQWKLDSLYEAGEGDLLYFQERIVSYTVFGEKYDFINYLREFIEDYQESGSVLGKMHKDVDYQTATNPGVYCILSLIPFASTKESILYLGNEYRVENKKPKGHYCEGFDEEDGLYFQFINDDEMDEYADLSGDQDMINSIKPKVSINHDRLARVIMIINGYQDRVFYFFRMEGEWYLWIEDFCDCSA